MFSNSLDATTESETSPTYPPERALFGLLCASRTFHKGLFDSSSEIALSLHFRALSQAEPTGSSIKKEKK